MKTVEQVLASKQAGVATIGPDGTVLEALQLMAERGVGALVVAEDATVRGLISERDYAGKVALEGRSSKQTPVREIMTAKVICVAPDQSMDGCMALMTEKRIRHLPVVVDRQLVGIISIGDVVKAVIEEQQFTIEQLTHYIQGEGAH